MSIQLYLRERSSVALDWLADTTLPAVELNVTLDLERSGVGRVARDANQYQPLLICSRAVVDDLGTDEGGMAVEDLLRRGRRVGDGPVVNRRLRDEAEGRVRNPFPEDDVLVTDVGLDLLLSLDVEDLECATG